MGRILVTGFGPFGHVAENPSAALAEGSGERFEVLEVSYQAAEVFVNTLEPESFDVWVMLGVAASRSKLSIELFARNVRSGKDVLGIEGLGVIDSQGPLLLESKLWTPELGSEFVELDSKLVQVSMNAGSYLCNYLSYLGIRRFPQKRVGFLHVVMPEQVALEEQARLVKDMLGKVDKG